MYNIYIYSRKIFTFFDLWSKIFKINYITDLNDIYYGLIIIDILCKFLFKDKKCVATR